MKTALFSRTYWKSKEFKSTDKARAAEKSAALVFNFGGAPMKRKKLWKVFYYKGKEIFSYTMPEQVGEEEKSTLRLLAYENRCSPASIHVYMELR